MYSEQRGTKTQNKDQYVKNRAFKVFLDLKGVVRFF